MAKRIKLKLAMAAWETGRVAAGLGVKTGGLGSVIEELPVELLAEADREGIDLSIEILTPCFAHYDRSKLTRVRTRETVFLDGYTFPFEVYRYTVSDRLSYVFFWDDWQLNWTNPAAIYPSDPQVGLKLYAVISQAMAGYIERRKFDIVHAHDYHVGLIPFYLSDGFLAKSAFHFTIHNASYQGIVGIDGHGYELLARIKLPGEKFFHRYFEAGDSVNFMKAAMLKAHESGGKITTVSGDLKATWGYAAELKQSAAGIHERARRQKEWRAVREVFVPNRFLDVFEQLPIIGVTNGMSAVNRPENLPELKCARLREVQNSLPKGSSIFRHPEVQETMLKKDHSFDHSRLEIKNELKRLLCLEAFGEEPPSDLILVTAVGRLVEQKNLGLVADIVERTLAFDSGVRFAVLASAPDGDWEGKLTEARFAALAARYPSSFFFHNGFNLPLSKLILAGGDFSLIPSRFEPCGLVDYESSLLGTVVVAHRVGGLAKVAHCAYLYDWLDVGDREGEVEAFFAQLKHAISVYRTEPLKHLDLVKDAMAVEVGWEKSASRYLEIYRYGMAYREWLLRRRRILKGISRTARELIKKEPSFGSLFHPVTSDVLEQELTRAIDELNRAKPAKNG